MIRRLYTERLKRHARSASDDISREAIKRWKTQPEEDEKTASEPERKPPTFYGKAFKGPHKQLLNKAIRHNSKGKPFHVMLTYRKADGTESTRKVTPYTTNKDVVVGKDHSREGDIRSFKLERILKMEKVAMQNVFEGFEKAAAGNVGHAMDLAGLGLLAAPSVTALSGGKEWSEKNKHRAEVVGLGAIAAPVAHEMITNLIKRRGH